MTASEFAKEILGVLLHPWQEEMLDNLEKARDLERLDAIRLFYHNCNKEETVEKLYVGGGGVVRGGYVSINAFVNAIVGDIVSVPGADITWLSPTDDIYTHGARYRVPLTDVRTLTRAERDAFDNGYRGEVKWAQTPQPGCYFISTPMHPSLTRPYALESVRRELERKVVRLESEAKQLRQANTELAHKVQRLEAHPIVYNYSDSWLAPGGIHYVKQGSGREAFLEKEVERLALEKEQLRKRLGTKEREGWWSPERMSALRKTYTDEVAAFRASTSAGDHYGSFLSGQVASVLDTLYRKLGL